MNHICSLLLLSVIFTSCNGQTNNIQPNGAAVEALSFTGKNTKLVKTQGSNEYDNVHAIIQDKAGNIWIATTGEGVYRYDGKLFTQFTEKDGLSSNTVWSVLEDKQGYIWFATNDGVSRYNGKTISKVPLVISSPGDFSIAIPKPADKIVWSMMQDKTGMIWFGTGSGIICYDGKTFSNFLNNKNITNKNGLTLKSMQCMYEDTNGNIWFGSGPEASEGICLFDGKSLTNFKPQNETWIRKITVDKQGTLLFATRRYGLLAYNGKTFSNYAEPGNLNKQLLTSILADSKGNTWYGSDYTNNSDVRTGGFWKLNGHAFDEFKKQDGLSNTAVYSLAEDKAGNIWIGTRNCGLYRYNGQSFESFSE